MDIEKMKKHLGYDNDHSFLPLELPKPIMELARELRSGIEKYIETTGKQPEVISLTRKGAEQLRIAPKHIVEFDGIPVEFLGPEAPNNLVFLLK